MSSTNRNPRRGYGSGSLYTRTTSTGDVWYGRWYAGDQRVKRRIGPKRTPTQSAGLTRTQAEARLRELMAETEPPPAAGALVTVGQVADGYLDRVRRLNRKLSTQQDIASHLNRHIRPYMGDRPIAQVTMADVDDFVAVLARKTWGGKPLAPKTVRNVYDTLSAMCNWARRAPHRWITVNPCDGVELPDAPDEPTEIRFLTLDELDQTIDHATDSEYQQLDRALWRTAAMTGLRSGELCALRWQDIDWLAQRIRVHRNYVRKHTGTPKSRRARSVPMPLEVAAALDHHSKASAWQADTDLVFGHPATGEPLGKPGMLRRLRAALKAAELDDTHRFHDLRHTFGTQMAAAGVPLRTIQEWMGHANIATTEIYAAYAPSAREADIVEAAFARSRTAARGPIGGPFQAHPAAPNSTQAQQNQAI